MKAALTGATGLVGSHLAEALAARGHVVSALVRSPAKADALRAIGCRLVEGTLEDERALSALVEGQDVVYHAAGLVAARERADFERVNHDGAGRVARASARAAVSRLVLVSSQAVTGPSLRGQALDEGAGSGPVTAYGRSKQGGEEAVREAGVPFTIVRPTAVYGPRDRAFLPLFRAAARGLVPLLGDGLQELTLVDVRDLALALLAAGTTPRTLGRTYHAGNATAVTQRELASAVGRALGRRVRCIALPSSVARPLLAAVGLASRALGRAPLLDGDKANELLAPAWVCSSDALRRDAGWTARIPLETGLADTAASYRGCGWL